MNSFRNYLPTTIGNSSRNSYQIRPRSYSLTNQIPNSPQFCSRSRGISFLAPQTTKREHSARRNSFLIEENRPSYRSNSIRIENYRPMNDKNAFSFRNIPNKVYMNSQSNYQSKKDLSFNMNRQKDLQKENCIKKPLNPSNLKKYRNPKESKVLIHNQGTMQNIKALEGRVSQKKSTKENFLFNKLRDTFVMLTDSRMTESISLK